MSKEKKAEKLLTKKSPEEIRRDKRLLKEYNKLLRELKKETGELIEYFVYKEGYSEHDFLLLSLLGTLYRQLTPLKWSKKYERKKPRRN